MTRLRLVIRFGGDVFGHWLEFVGDVNEVIDALLARGDEAKIVEEVLELGRITCHWALAAGGKGGDKARVPATAVSVYFSMGKPTLLPHSVQEPS